MPTDNDMILLPNLVIGGLYYIKARNAHVGIWSKRNHSNPKYEYGFIIARTKFKYTFLDCEYHWDTCEQHGTVKPLQFIEQSPTDMDDNTKLQYLIQKETEYDRRREGVETKGISG